MDPDRGGGASRTTEPASGSSAATDVSLREFVGVQIRYERQTTRLLIGGVVAFAAFSWSQIMRRLEGLNHENARVAAVVANTVSADTYFSDEKRRTDERDKIDGWRAGVDEKFTKSVTKEEVHEDARDGRRVRFNGGTAAIAAVAAVAAALLLFLTYENAKRSNGPTAPIRIVVTVPTAKAVGR